MTGSTKSCSENISDPVRAIFTVFRANYKNLFKLNYPDRTALHKDMALWELKFGRTSPMRLKQAAEMCIEKYSYQPNIAQFKLMLSMTDEPACHRLYKRLPSPPRTEEEKARRAKYFASLRSELTS